MTGIAIGIAMSTVTIGGMAGGGAIGIETAMTVGIAVAGAIATGMIDTGIVTTGAIAAMDGTATIATAITTATSKEFTTKADGGIHH
jgi:hypothetical protein